MKKKKGATREREADCTASPAGSTESWVTKSVGALHVSGRILFAILLTAF